MRVKLRAGTHFAPLPQGVYVAGATGPAFVLTGPPVLYQVLDSQVGLLCAGTDTDALVAALGGEAARPVLDRVLRTLVDRDILLDLDGLGTPPPDGATADRYAEVLSYLEAHCAEPYKVFAQVQAATVAVVGGGPAAGVLERTLRRYGIGRVVVLPTGQPVPVRPDVVVLLDDPDSPLDALAYSRSRPDDAVTVVTAREAVALVGAGLVGPAGMAGFLALAGRAEGWAVVEPDLAAPRPLSAVLAGSLAAHAVLRHLIGGDLPPATPGGDLPPATPGGDLPPAAPGGDAPPAAPGGDAPPAAPRGPAPAGPTAGVDGAAVRDPLPGNGSVAEVGPPAAAAAVTVVHGPELATRRLSLPPRAGTARGRVEAEAGGVAGTAPAQDHDADHPVADPEQIVAGWAGLTDRWTGRLRRGRDLDLIQMPMSLATVDLVPTTGSSTVDGVAGWGTDRSRAGLDALLVATRRMAAPPGGHPDTVGAAGVTPRRWLLDGILRLLTGSVLAARPVEVGWADLATADQRTRWSLCTDYFDRTIRVYRRDLPGTGLVLAEVVDASGEIRVAEWGTSAASAVHLALGTAVAHAQATAGVRARLADPPAGTRILQSARPEQLDGVLDHLRALLASQGRRPHADPLPPDPVAGAWPLSCGTVTLS